MEYKPRKFSIDDIVAAWKDGSLKISEEYQRGASRSQSQMQSPIDSIFRQYPIPPTFLHPIRVRGLGGLESTRYEIVDGQRRIRALADVPSDKFPLLDASDNKLRPPRKPASHILSDRDANAAGKSTSGPAHGKILSRMANHFPLSHSLAGRTVVENGRPVHLACYPRGAVELKTVTNGA